MTNGDTVFAQDTALSQYARNHLGLAYDDGRIALIAADLERFRAALAAAGPLDPTIEPGVTFCRRLVYTAPA